ncbi:MAG: DUF1573 domain-containing protein [bacterium]
MKKVSFFTLIFLFLVSVSLSAQQAKITYHNSDTTAKVKKNGPVATFDKTTNDFGNIDQGIPKTAEFTLTNEGNEPLLISSAKASCGCTNLNYSQEPIMPKKSTKISATYNAAAPGPFTKTITVVTNADANPVVLWIKGTVIKKEEPAPTGTK